MKLTASSRPISLQFGTFFKEELKQTRSLFTHGSKPAEGPFEGFSVFNYNEDKGWGYMTSQTAFIFILETMAIFEFPTHINEIQGHNFSIFSDSRCVTTTISSSKNYKKIPIYFPY